MADKGESEEITINVKSTKEKMEIKISPEKSVKEVSTETAVLEGGETLLKFISNYSVYKAEVDSQGPTRKGFEG